MLHVLGYADMLCFLAAITACSFFATKTDIKDNKGKTPLSSTGDKAIINLPQKEQIIETTTSFVKERPSNRIASIMINIIQRTPYTPFGPL